MSVELDRRAEPSWIGRIEFELGFGNWTAGSSAQQQAANINTRQQARNRILDNLQAGIKDHA